MAKQVRTKIHNRHRMVIDSVPGIIAEQCRVYRLAVNGHLKPSEMGQYMAGLREIRNSVESLPPEPAPETSAEAPVSLNIISISQDTYIRDLATKTPNLVLEHIPTEAPIPPPIEAQKPSGPQPSPEQAEAEDRIINNLKGQINALARQAGLPGVS